ncbi:MAG: 3-deoxy-7-phosphoheptulonate synthase, partial [Paenibacillus sp.]|nr:3-deoxy-7-phosphoheptulonate synthase [Paenibacillus sp.]
MNVTTSHQIEQLEQQIDAQNIAMLQLLTEQANTIGELVRLQQSDGTPQHDPLREKARLEELVSGYEGPLDRAKVRHLFQEIGKATRQQEAASRKRQLLVSRSSKAEDTVLHIRDTSIGGTSSVLVAGPCSVESEAQVREVAAALKKAGVPVIRGGAFKPRTSPYDFQGLGFEGLRLLKEAADEYGLLTISEIVDPAHLQRAAEYVDIIQIGARNMQNFELLKAVGETTMPVLLKRGPSATLEELILAAEYILKGGNEQVMLIERGIRTFETWTRNTLDISAVPILKQETHLPVLVDVSHS